MKVALFFPSTANFDLYLRRYDSVNNGIIEMVPDFLNSFGSSGTVLYDTGPGSDNFAGIEMEVLITTTSISTTYGDFYVGISQSDSNVDPLTISQNSCVEVLKFS